MRIDIIQPQPIPEITKVSEGNNTAATNDNDFNRQLGKYASDYNKKNDKTDGSSFKDEVDRLNEKMQPGGKKIQFKLLKDPNQVIAQIVDSKTNEVLEEIPSEKLMEIINSIGKENGKNIDKKV